MILKKLTRAFNRYIGQYAGFDRQIWLSVLFNFLNNIILSTSYFLPIYFTKQLKMDIATSGLIVGCYGIGTMIGGIVSGKLADRMSPITICNISMGIQGLSYLGLIFFHTKLPLMLTQLMLGIGTYGFITTIYLIALTLCIDCKVKRLKAINLLDTTTNLGLGLSAIIIGLLPYNMMFYFFGGASVLLLMLSSLFWAVFPSQRKIDQNVDADDKHIHVVNPYFIYHVLFCLFVAGFIISQLNSNYSIHLSKLFPSENAFSFSLIFATNTFLIAILQTPIISYLNKYNHLLVIGHGVFLLGFGMLILVISESLLLVFLSCILYTLGEICFFSMSQSICYENASREKKGSILGTYRMIYAISRIVGPVTGGFLYQKFNSHYLWYSCGALGSACFFITLYLYYRIKQLTAYSHSL